MARAQALLLWKAEGDYFAMVKAADEPEGLTGTLVAVTPETDASVVSDAWDAWVVAYQ